MELFDPELNFLFERIGTEGSKFGFRNASPRAGESGVYSCAFPADKPHETYSTLVLLPNLAHNGMVLLLNGASMESSEAAGEFAMNDNFPEVIAKLPGPAPNREIPFLELLLRVHVTAGAPDNAEVLAWRKPRM